MPTIQFFIQQLPREHHAKILTSFLKNVFISEIETLLERVAAGSFQRAHRLMFAGKIFMLTCFGSLLSAMFGAAFKKESAQASHITEAFFILGSVISGFISIVSLSRGAKAIDSLEYTANAFDKKLFELTAIFCGNQNMVIVPEKEVLKNLDVLDMVKKIKQLKKELQKSMKSLEKLAQGEILGEKTSLFKSENGDKTISDAEQGMFAYLAHLGIDVNFQYGNQDSMVENMRLEANNQSNDPNLKKAYCWLSKEILSQAATSNNTGPLEIGVLN